MSPSSLFLHPPLPPGPASPAATPPKPPPPPRRSWTGPRAQGQPASAPPPPLCEPSAPGPPEWEGRRERVRERKGKREGERKGEKRVRWNVRELHNVDRSLARLSLARNMQQLMGAHVLHTGGLAPRRLPYSPPTCASLAASAAASASPFVLRASAWALEAAARSDAASCACSHAKKRVCVCVCVRVRRARGGGESNKGAGEQHRPRWRNIARVKGAWWAKAASTLASTSRCRPSS